MAHSLRGKFSESFQRSHQKSSSNLSNAAADLPRPGWAVALLFRVVLRPRTRPRLKLEQVCGHSRRPPTVTVSPWTSSEVSEGRPPTLEFSPRSCYRPCSPVPRMMMMEMQPATSPAAVSVLEYACKLAVKPQEDAAGRMSTQRGIVRLGHRC